MEVYKGRLIAYSLGNFMGYAQFGYRFGLDFLPYLYALLLIGLSRSGPRLGRGLRVLIVVSMCLDAYLLEAYLGPG